MEDGILLIINFFAPYTFLLYMCIERNIEISLYMCTQLLCTVAHVQHCTHVYTCIMYVCTVSYRLGI